MSPEQIAEAQKLAREWKAVLTRVVRVKRESGPVEERQEVQDAKK